LKSLYRAALRLLWIIGSVEFGTLLGCGGGSPTVKTEPTPKVQMNDPASLAKLSDQELETRYGQQIKTMCGYCHENVDGSEASREEWRHEIEQAFKFHRNSPRKDEPAPEMEAVIAYFERKARPYEDYSAPPLGDADPGSLRFKTTEIQLASTWTLPALSGITWSAPQGGGSGSLLVCEMRSGGLYKVGLGDGKSAPSIAPLIHPGSIFLSNPSHAQECDLDGDDQSDLVVGDLGVFLPGDETHGRVVWLRRTSADNYEPIEIANSLGRIADVEPGDFDGDGDLDLVVGEFGWRQTGSIRLLKNLGMVQGQLKFELATLDPRHGTIHVPVVDLNRDGKLDFVALISQEHEMVEAFLGKGDGTFDKQRIYSAPHPSWGSSGIHLVDFDADGDLDVLSANGDTFDRGQLRPYHAVQWLENRGSFPWVQHELAKMPGCHRAMAGDLDGDGDLDVVAVSLLAPEILDRFGKEKFDAVCWMEQIAPGKFVRRTLELGTCDHASMEMADFDADGDLDLAVGNFFFGESGEIMNSPSLKIWWNETPRPSRASKAQ
jgi:hypothetical protein